MQDSRTSAIPSLVVGRSYGFTIIELLVASAIAAVLMLSVRLASCPNWAETRLVWPNALEDCRPFRR